MTKVAKEKELDKDLVAWLGGDKNALGIDIWYNKYRKGEETFIEFIHRVSGGDKELEELLLKHMFLFGGRILSNRGLQNLGYKITYSNCFVAGMKVNTARGMVNIEDIVEGDYVLSHDGTYNRVNATMCREYYGDLYKLSSNEFYNPIICTPNHQFLTNHGWKRADRILACSEQVKSQDRLKIAKSNFNYTANNGQYGTIDLFNSIDLGDGKRICVKGNKLQLETYSTDSRTNRGYWMRAGNPVNRYLTMTNEFMYFIGRWLGDGSITRRRGKRNHNILQIVFNATTETKAFEMCKTIGENIFGIKPNICYTKQNTIALRFENEIIGSWFYKEFGEKCDGKRIPDKYLGNFNMMIGLCDSDGCVDSHGSFKIVLKNLSMMQWLRETMYLNNINASDIRPVPTQEDTYIMHVSTGQSNAKLNPFLTRSYYDMRMNSISMSHGDFASVRNMEIIENTHTVVYNLSVENTHTYTVNGVDTHNCYVITAPSDNIESIFECAAKLARTYSYGGGCGIDISKLAPKGAIVRNSAKQTSGSVTFMDLYSLVTELIGQNGRRGALMITIDCTHPDLLDFINVKKDLDKVTKANISIKVTKEFMEAVKNHEMFTLRFTRVETGESICRSVDAYTIFKQFAENNWAMAEPGLLFWDRISNYNLLSNNKDFEYAGTNPCVSGDTMILTDRGYKKIKLLAEEGKPVNVWNGYEWSEVVPKITGHNQRMRRVHFSNGVTLECTDYHSFIINRMGGERAPVLQLKAGQYLCPWKFPVITNKDGLRIMNAYTKGEHYDEVIDPIPGGNYTIKSRLDWLFGYIHNRAKRTEEKDSVLCIFEKERNALRFKYLLNTLGCDVIIRKDDKYKIDLPVNTIRYLQNLIYVSKPPILLEEHLRYNEELLVNTDGKAVRITKIETIENAETVYCFNEPINHTGIFNGIMTGQCGEEPLPAGGSCLLGSLNLATFVNEEGKFMTSTFRKAVRTSVRALNECLIEGLDLHPLEEQRESVRKLRQIGLGIMGLADCLIKMKLRYGSPEAIKQCDEIGKMLIRTALSESCNIAKETHSVYEGFDADEVLSTEFFKTVGTKTLEQEIRKYGLFNSQLLTCAPTGSISTMLGISGGIEPIFANSYTRKTESLKGHDEYYKVYTPIVKEYIEANQLEDDSQLPDYFVTAQDLDYHERIDMQAVWQKYIDASISSTVNLPESTTVEDIIDLYIYAYEKGLKGITIYRDNCDRSGILETKKEKEVPAVSDKKELARGDVIKVNNNAVGLERHLMTGCGSLHCAGFFDPKTGQLVECYLSKGSTGGCQSNLAAVSRLISLSARAGVDIFEIADQLDSCMSCPSYAVRTATRKDTSPGSCCPVAVGKALTSMYVEFNQNNTREKDTIIDGEATIVEEKAITAKSKLIEKDSDQVKIDNGICPVCGLKIHHRNGCIECDCGWSRCG